MEVADLMLGADDDDDDEKKKKATENTGDESTELDDELEEAEPPNTARDDACFSTSEVHGMTKLRAIYVYRNRKHLNEAIEAGKPVAGIVVVSNGSDGKTSFEFQTVHRKPVKQFARRRVNFNDDLGEQYHGLWCASIEVEGSECVPSTADFANIQSAAKLSDVALPLWYLVGKEHPSAFKHCVITSWWKYRMSDGWYRMPTLDASLYGGTQGTAHDFEVDPLPEPDLADDDVKFPTEAVSVPPSTSEANAPGVI